MCNKAIVSLKFRGEYPIYHLRPTDRCVDVIKIRCIMGRYICNRDM